MGGVGFWWGLWVLGGLWGCLFCCGSGGGGGFVGVGLVLGEFRGGSWGWGGDGLVVCWWGFVGLVPAVSPCRPLLNAAAPSSAAGDKDRGPKKEQFAKTS